MGNTGPQLAQRLRKYTSGTFAGIFSQQSNIDINNPLVVFNIRDLEDELRQALQGHEPGDAEDVHGGRLHRDVERLEAHDRRRDDAVVGDGVEGDRRHPLADRDDRHRPAVAARLQLREGALGDLVGLQRFAEDDVRRVDLRRAGAFIRAASRTAGRM